MLDNKFYGELMAGCQVMDGVIKFSSSLNPETLFEVYQRLSHDLFDRLVPHYRVVGIWHGFDEKHDRSLFRTNDIYGQSCIELTRKLRYLVPLRNGGNDGNAGCFYSITEDMTEFVKNSENFRGFCRMWGLDNGKGADACTANLLTRSRFEVGSLMMDTLHDDEPQKNVITTSDVWYTQFSSYDVTFPRVLIPNKFLTELYELQTGHAPTFMFIMRGTGHMSYVETQALFNLRCENIMPCETAFDLTDFFVIRVPDPGDTVLKITYLEQINEPVLECILQEYGEELAKNEC